METRRDAGITGGRKPTPTFTPAWAARRAKHRRELRNDTNGQSATVESPKLNGIQAYLQRRWRWAEVPRV
jgi:hypothetical protein